MFRAPSDWSFAGVLEAHWRTIREEFHGVRHELVDWFERELYGEGWQVFGLFDFPHGRPIATNVAKCPVTAALVAEHVPRHGAAGFSVLAPRTRIRPHVGYQGDFLRCHLGLEIPDGDCGLRVGDTTRRWEEGRVLVFDDRHDHEAWNMSDASRAVLLIDFVP